MHMHTCMNIDHLDVNNHTNFSAVVSNVQQFTFTGISLLIGESLLVFTQILLKD